VSRAPGAWENPGVALSAFDDREAAPTGPALSRALGKALPAWVSLRDKVLRECAPLSQEWGFAGANFGWSLRLKRGKRVILYMTPGHGHFLASLALGEKACAAARDEGLPPALLAAIADAPRYPEGRGLRITVRTRRDADGMARLAAIKLEH
jgi:hypothetical protein